MRFKLNHKHKSILLMILLIPIIISLENSSYKKYEFKEDSNQKQTTELRTIRQANYWNVDHIYIKNDNWSQTELDWIQNRTGTWDDPHIIENVTINTLVTSYCINIENSSEYFIIQNCTLINSYGGILLNDTRNGQIIETNCSDDDYGLNIFNSKNLTLQNNNIQDISNYGIDIRSFSNNNTIKGNIARSCAKTALLMIDGCFNNILKNDFNLNYKGIELRNSSNNKIGENTIHGTTGSDGIYLQNNCTNNTIFENIVDFCTRGIYLRTNSSHNIVTKNRLINNTVNGIHIYTGCNSNNLTENMIINNTNNGIRIDSFSNDNLVWGNWIKNNDDYGININNPNCQDNIIYQNGIANHNIANANDLGTNTAWNSPTLGNYWSDYNGVDISPIDGIGDSAYTNIAGGKQDDYPLMESPAFNGSLIHIDNIGNSLINWSSTARLKVWCTGSGTFRNPYMISDLEIDGKRLDNCILIEDSKVYFTIEKCYVYNSKLTIDTAGIKLERTSNGTIKQNTCYQNNQAIFLWSACKNNTIENNIVYNNSNFGITIDESTNTTIRNNIILNNVGGTQTKGLVIDGMSDNNTIINNTIKNNLDYGIYSAYSENNDYINNTISNDEGNNQDYGIYFPSNVINNTLKNNIITNHSIAGIYIWNNCEDNQIIKNFIENSTEYGIYLENTNYNNFTGNYITNTQNIGIYLENSNNNKFTGNYITNTKNSGVLIFDTDSKFNIFYMNYFIGNSISAKDDSGYNFNQWDDGSIGNYWDDYNGIDSDDNGIGDTPYIISGVAVSKDNFPIWDDGPGPFPSDDDDDSTPQELDLVLILMIIIIGLLGAISVGFISKKTSAKKMKLRMKEIADYGDGEGKNLIFVSYATIDSSIFRIPKMAEVLSSYPEIDDVLYWEEDMHDDIYAYMDENLKRCKVVLLFCTRNSMASDAVNMEWRSALKKQRKVIPIFIDQDDIPPLLTTKLGVEFKESDVVGSFEQIYKLILKKLEIESTRQFCQYIKPKHISEHKFEPLTSLMAKEEAIIESGRSMVELEQEFEKILKENNFYQIEKPTDLSETEFNKIFGFAEQIFDASKIGVYIFIQKTEAQTSKILLRVMSDKKWIVEEVLKELKANCDYLTK